MKSFSPASCGCHLLEDNLAAKCLTINYLSRCTQIIYGSYFVPKIIPSSKVLGNVEITMEFANVLYNFIRRSFRVSHKNSNIAKGRLMVPSLLNRYCVLQVHC